ncbi:MAG: hypothetical protein OEM52_04690 [bacterium]|nr:hypothetical protein [bacterium]
MESYISWVTEYPLLSAAIQFSLLGTLGEVLSGVIRSRKLQLSFSPIMLLGKMLVWAVLGIVIKYGFTGMRGFVNGLLEHQMLPAIVSSGIGFAFVLSTLTNVFFGPQMMFFHRLEDNLLERRINFGGIDRALWTLLWFWIPAHTITFALPKEYQIGLASVWSVALGIILGLSAPKSQKV